MSASPAPGMNLDQWPLCEECGEEPATDVDGLCDQCAESFDMSDSRARAAIQEQQG